MWFKYAINTLKGLPGATNVQELSNGFLKIE
jgi:hypothetical protein